MTRIPTDFVEEMLARGTVAGLENASDILIDSLMRDLLDARKELEKYKPDPKVKTMIYDYIRANSRNGNVTNCLCVSIYVSTTKPQAVAALILELMEEGLVKQINEGLVATENIPTGVQIL